MPTSTQPTSSDLSLKDRSTWIQRSLQTGERTPLRWFDSRSSTQHNLRLADGLGPLLEFMDSLPPDRTRVEVLRAIEDGAFSVLHCDYDLGDWGAIVGFEIHRWHDDRIVEHWDALCPRPASTNASGRTMTDGPAGVGDLASTAANKAVIEAYTSTVLIAGDATDLASFVASRLVEHAPDRGDGRDALAAALWTRRAAHARLRLLLGEGALVLAASEGLLDGASAALYDLYRLERGRIAEHWEFHEVLSAPELQENSNGKF